MPSRRSPDTHNPAVQASATKIINILRMAYPFIESLTPEATLDSPVKLAQASLLNYLNGVINPESPVSEAEEALAPESPVSEAEKALAKAKLNIKGTMQWIDYVNKLPSETLSPQDKKKVFEQMEVIAKIYPGAAWDEQQEQWSINRFYNKDTGEDDMIMMPPAEALNLVCTALFDETRYLADEGTWKDDLAFRIRTVYSALLDLRQQREKGDLEKCAAGLQHDLLYFLNMAYLDKPRDEGGKPVELLMDIEPFLEGSLSAFVADRIKEKSREAATSKMILKWMHWATMTSADDDELENPMILWLTNLFPTEVKDAGWKHACTQYIISRCEEFGLNPINCRIAGYVDTLPYIPVVVSHDAVLPLVYEIMQMGALAIPQTNLTAWPPSSIYSLIALRNQALVEFKAQPQPEIIQQHAESIRDLFSALVCVDSVYRYRDVSMLIGAEDGRFKKVHTQLQTLLLSYFTNYSLDKRIPTILFENARLAYFTAESKFLNQNNTDLIGNFFALMDGQRKTWDAAWARLLALRHDMVRPHPLVLSDDALRDWLRQSESISADGQTVVDITPYAINRLLLHGFLTPIHDWSPLYCQYLTLVTDWLLRPAELSEGLLIALKKAYPYHLLDNLRFIALVKSAALDDELKEHLFQVVPSPWDLSYTEDLFIDLFKRPLEQLSGAQRTEILTAVAGKLGTMIDSYDKLHNLLKLPQEQLSETQRTQILTAVAGKLGTMIDSNTKLHNLLKLPPEQLSEAQRTQILTALTDVLNNIMKKGYGIHIFFKLSPEQLTGAQRTYILTAVANQLSTLIRNGRELYLLFQLPPAQLSDVQRTQIWTAAASQLSTIIKNVSELSDLFSLSLAELSEAQRTDIWSAVTDQLGAMTMSGRELYCLFNLSPAQLSDVQRTQIWTAAANQLSTMSVNEIPHLFGLSLAQLSETQRTEIWSAVIDQLGTMKISRDELYKLFNLSLAQLSETQRTDIWSAVTDQLGTMKISGDELYKLFNLSLAQLSETQRTDIWSAVTDQLGTMKISGDELYKLFNLSSAQFCDAQRTQILTAVEGKLGEMVIRHDKLYNFFKLPPEQLSVAQRTQILTAVADTLDRIINTADELYSFFQLPPEQLSDTQRTQILKALEGGLGWMVSGNHLCKFFKLLPEQLSDEQRTQLLTAVVKSRPRISEELGSLLNLLPEELNKEHRAQILEVTTKRAQEFGKNRNGFFSEDKHTTTAAANDGAGVSP